MTRLCFGEFDWPDVSGKRSFAQRLFLLTLQKLNQAPLRQLYGEPFQLYRMAKNEFHLEHYFIRKPWLLTGPAVSLVETLEAQIERWAKTWNLDARWCRQTALETLHLWSCASREITELCFQPPTYGGFVPTRLEPPEGLPGVCRFRDET